ncbi:MAG: hypothetical protein M1828_005669 [Chrysothrix sp. TS-e1954]|nr:MAG: hypothetical protein M1828_005669 [Chrysothrix sp. TS-e1954]
MATTVKVFNLDGRLTHTEVETFFRDNIPGCKPEASPVIWYDKEQYGGTLVSFQLPEGHSLAAAIKTLQTTTLFFDGGYSEVGISKDFENLTVVAENKDPAFDLVFVHGLDGHAFDTFAVHVEGSQYPNMWPRDLLPAALEKRQLFGRFSTFGHDASYTKLRSGALKESVGNTAERDF